MVNAQRITARDVQIVLNDTVIGGAEELTITVASDNKIAPEAGNYWPAEIVDGGRTVAGTVTKAFLDTDLIKELIPSGTLTLLPSFTLVSSVISGKTPKRKITVFGAKFKNFDISDLSVTADYAKNKLEFDGLNYQLD